MLLNDYQQLAKLTSKYRDSPDTERRLVTATLGLCGESGEASEHVKKWYGHGKPLAEEKLFDELGDALWYIAEACSSKGWTLSSLADYNIAKLKARYPNGYSPVKADA